MSGIAGLFSLDGRPVEASEVTRMLAASRYRPLDGEDVRVRGTFGIGCQHSRITPESLRDLQPLVAASGVIVGLDGRIDNREDLGGSELSDCALVLAAYEQSGDGFASRLNGEFAIALFDARSQRLVLARDVMASRPLYYCQVPGALLFASEIKCLLADPRVRTAPDEDSLADLVLNNWYDDHRTCFKEIYSVPAGQCVLATPDGVTLRVHWAFDPLREIRFTSFTEYLESFRGLFEQSVRRRLRSAHPVAVTVSGGLDSSAVFCQAASIIRRESLPVALHGIAMTFAEGTPADERSFLVDIERAYDTRVERMPVSELRFLTDADAVIRHLETPTLAAHTHAELYDRVRRAGCRVILHGYFGDQMMFGRAYLVDLARQWRWLTIRRELREFAAWMTDEDVAVFQREFWGRLVRALPPRWVLRLAKQAADLVRRPYSPVFTQSFRARARARASARSDAPRRFAGAHAEQIYRNATSGHYLNHVQIESGIGVMHGLEASYPFRDRDLVAFVMAIPGEIVNRNGVPKALMREALGGVLPDAIRGRRWKADFTELNRGGTEDDRGNLARLQRDGSLAVCAGFVDGGVLERSARLHWRVPDPIGLERWLLQFFGSSLAART